MELYTSESFLALAMANYTCEKIILKHDEMHLSIPFHLSFVENDILISLGKEYDMQVIHPPL